MKNIFSILFLFILCTQLVAQNTDYQLVWADEFNYEGLPDSTKWTYDVGDGCPDLCGWGNNELQFYTEDRLKNARVNNGYLTIGVHKESFKTREYTSVRLLIRGKRAWKYGRFDGGWSRTRQGDNPEYNTPGKKTILEAVQDEIDSENVNFVEGSTIDEIINIGEARIY